MEATGLLTKPTIEKVELIIKSVKKRGLNGIAVTEHNNSDFGFEVKKIVEDVFNNEIIIIPGREITVVEMGWAEMVELYLPDDLIFRFLPHPSFPYPGDEGFDYDMSLISGIEIGNYVHDRQINKKKVQEISEQYKLIQLTNSDAHNIEDIGAFSNEITVEELCSLAKDSL